MSTTDLPPTPEERRAEVAAILAAGCMRLARRPRPLPSNPQEEAKNRPGSIWGNSLEGRQKKHTDA